MRLLSVALACALLVLQPAPAEAYRKPPPPAPLPAEVWVDARGDLGWYAGMAAGLFNGHTSTPFACQLAEGEANVCDPAPCPSSRMCLTVQYGQFTDDSLDARYTPTYCSGGCRAGVIEINAEGPMRTMYGYWTPVHHLRLMVRHFGFFTGLPPQTACVSWMSAVSCPTQAFTPAEAAHLAAW